MEKKQIVYAFIDSQNVNLSIHDQGWKLDFGKFRVYLKDKYQVEKAFLFIGYVQGNEALYTYLQNCGFLIVFKPTLEYKKDGELHTKGNVDADLVLRTMIEYPHFTKAIIATGDGDFYCLVEYLIGMKKLLKVFIPNMYKYSALLRRFYPYLIFMNVLKKKIKLEKEHKKEAERPSDKTLGVPPHRDK